MAGLVLFYSPNEYLCMTLGATLGQFLFSFFPLCLPPYLSEGAGQDTGNYAVTGKGYRAS